MIASVSESPILAENCCFQCRPIRKYYKEKYRRMKEDVEYGPDDDEEPSIRVDSNHSGVGSTLYYPLQEHPSAPYNAPGNRECSFFGLLHAIGQCEPSKTRT